MHTWPSRDNTIIVPKRGIPNGIDDVAEAKAQLPMLPGSFLHEKEPGYEASVGEDGNDK